MRHQSHRRKRDGCAGWSAVRHRERDRHRRNRAFSVPGNLYLCSCSACSVSHRKRAPKISPGMVHPRPNDKSQRYNRHAFRPIAPGDFPRMIDLSRVEIVSNKNAESPALSISIAEDEASWLPLLRRSQAFLWRQRRNVAHDPIDHTRAIGLNGAAEMRA